MMMTRPRPPLVIFDCDGVLVDSEPISFAVLHDMLAEAGVELSVSRAYRDFLGKSMATVTRMIASEFDITLTEARIEAMRRRLFERFRAELKPVAGVRAALESLDLPHCVASSSQIERIRLSLTLTGLIDCFEPHIFSAAMVENGKPAPDLFLHAAASMGFAPGDCVVIEDSPAGIRAAKAAEMTVFGFVGGAHAAPSGLREKVEVLKPDAIFDDMGALAALLAARR